MLQQCFSSCICRGTCVSEENWYYRDAAKDAEVKGPLSQEALRKLFHYGALLPDTLVRKGESAEWSIAKAAPDFWFPITASGPQVRPWVRYWARGIDNICFFIIVVLLLVIFWPASLDYNDDSIAKVIGLFIFFAWAFIEAILLATWGTTPGKALLRVSVRNSYGRKLSFSQALLRSMLVFVKGDGLDLPPVTFLTNAFAYFHLKREGITTWDREGNFVVSHQRIGAVRVIIAVLLLVMFSVTMGYLFYVSE
jgi:uncharacterized RDD family membrane protein YckC